jgi:hypothetical protein
MIKYTHNYNYAKVVLWTKGREENLFPHFQQGELRSIFLIYLYLYKFIHTFFHLYIPINKNEDNLR